jgi:hypothetical protein
LREGVIIKKRRREERQRKRESERERAGKQCGSKYFLSRGRFKNLV